MNACLTHKQPFQFFPFFSFLEGVSFSSFCFTHHRGDTKAVKVTAPAGLTWEKALGDFLFDFN